MRLTEEQYKAMEPYKETFQTMVRSQWSRNPGSAALDLIHDTYDAVIGRKTTFNKGCQHCIMRLLTDMGKIFLADCEEREVEAQAPVEKPKKGKGKNTKK